MSSGGLLQGEGSGSGILRSDEMAEEKRLELLCRTLEGSREVRHRVFLAIKRYFQQNNQNQSGASLGDQ